MNFKPYFETIRSIIAKKFPWFSKLTDKDVSFEITHSKENNKSKITVKALKGSRRVINEGSVEYDSILIKDFLNQSNISLNHQFDKLSEVSEKLKTHGLLLKKIEEDKKYNLSKIIHDKNTLASLLVNDERSYIQFLDPETKQDYQGKKVCGLLLDTARKFYTVDQIKKFIKATKDDGGSYFQWHLSDDQNFALESNLLGQTTSPDSSIKDGIGYKNKKTNKYFYSKQQFIDIINYAKEIGIEIIPELGAPGHMKGIVDLLNIKRDQITVNNVFKDDELLFLKKEGKDFIKSLYDEFFNIYPEHIFEHFHIGGDEFAFDEEDGDGVIDYYNYLAKYLWKKGSRMRVWNDSILKTTISKLNPLVEITYWSYDGDKEDINDKNYLRRIRVTPEEIISAGFNLINCNSYYTYYVPRESEVTSHNSSFAGRDAWLNWDLSVWDGNSTGSKLSEDLVSKGVIGAQMSIWSEDSGSLSGDTLLLFSESHRKRIFDIVNSYNPKSVRDLNKIKEIANAGFVDEYYNFYLDLNQITNTNEVEHDLRWNGHETLYLLNIENNKNKVRNIKINGSEHDIVVLHEGFVKQSQSVGDYDIYKYQKIKISINKQIVIKRINKTEYPY